jgi:hypothetical protein
MAAPDFFFHRGAKWHQTKHKQVHRAGAAVHRDRKIAREAGVLTEASS